ncbi:27 kDa antigen Cfp30B [Enhygromyxa salina]|uniref:27 kDa antigen Cfp30B n=1 Tax=Enhygromyxa salina TaxID=215803 RepID=A0A2S9YEE9_9BACT|nr:VOC family protein [Enhygromyxa salina]PRQ03489.1 27 kDa antigen Cfp30B [Enhygromyxa salina]
MHTHHAIDYIELQATDLAEAKRFYAAAFGWTFNDYGPGYAGIQGPGGGTGREVGGLAQREEVTSGGPLVVLFSDDLDASVAAVERAGGRIVEPPFDFPGGRRFHFSDPSGNVLGVWAAPS